MFLADADNDLGYELYKWEIGPIVSTEDVDQRDFNIQLTDEGAILKADKNVALDLLLVNMNGTVLQEIKTETNAFVPLNYSHGMNFVVFKIGDQLITKKYIFIKN